MGSSEAEAMFETPFVAAPRKTPGYKKLSRILWYKILDKLRSKHFARNALLTVLNFVVLVVPIAMREWRYGLAYAALLVVVLLLRAAGNASPKNMQIVTHNYLRRKLHFYKIIEDLQSIDRLSRQP